MDALVTPRLILEPITLAQVEACFAGDRAALEDLARAAIPETWPGRTLIERAFCASLDAIRADPGTRLWGDRLIIATENDRRLAPRGRIVVGSVIFHGRPQGRVAEVGYGVEERWQKNGYASEATRACVDWALEQDGVDAVTATTPPWHAASIRVLERAGLVRIGSEDHESLGEVLRFERRR